MLYIKSTLSYKRRIDLEVQGVECIWVEINLKSNRKVMFGLFYRPPNTSAQIDSLIEESIDLTFNSGVSNIIVTGDFNLNTSSPNSARKLNALCNQFGFTQCINQPTHFTEHSSSLIDILLMNNVQFLLKCGVGEPFLDQNIRYHCPIFAFFKFTTPKIPTLKRKIWLFDQGNYESLRQAVASQNWDILFDQDINRWVENITNYLLDISIQFIPNRIVTIKPSEPNGLPLT